MGVNVAVGGVVAVGGGGSVVAVGGTSVATGGVVAVGGTDVATGGLFRVAVALGGLVGTLVGVDAVVG